MSGFTISTLSDTTKGIIAVVGGTIFLLYTLDLLGTWINGVFIFLAVGIIIYGLIKLNIVSYWHKIMRKKKNAPTQVPHDTTQN